MGDKKIRTWKESIVVGGTEADEDEPQSRDVLICGLNCHTANAIQTHSEAGFETGLPSMIEDINSLHRYYTATRMSYMQLISLSDPSGRAV
jgi:hypothetical protein